LWRELGLALTPLGEEARVDLRGFTLDAPAHRDLRQACAKLGRLGLQFEIVERDGVAALLPTLDAISRAWLERKATSEKGLLERVVRRGVPQPIPRGHREER